MLTLGDVGEQNEQITNDIWDMKTPKITSSSGQRGCHANLRGWRRRWWWNDDAAKMCLLEEKNDDEMKMQQ